MPTSPLLWSGVPLLIVAIISFFQASSLRMALWGQGFEFGTVGSFFLFVMAMVLGALVSRKILVLNIVLFVTTLIAIVSGGLVFFFPDSWGNVSAGTWPQVSFLIAGALCLAIGLLTQERNNVRRTFYAGCAVVLALAFVLFFHPVAAVLCTVAFSFESVRHLFSKKPESGLQLACTASAAILFASLLVFGVRGPLLHLSPDMRPSLFSSELIAGPTYLNSLSSALVGTGPNTFAKTWNLYRTIEFNMAPQWDSTPESGYSSAVTVAVSLGFLGLFAFLLCPFGLLYVIIKKYNESDVTAFHNPAFVGACVLAFFLFASAIVYPIGTGLFLVAGLALGICAGSLSDDVIVIHLGFWRKMFFFVVFGIIGATLLWVLAHQLSGAFYHARAEKLQAENNLTDAARSHEWAADIWPISRYKSDAARAYLRFAFSIPGGEDASGGARAEAAVMSAKSFADMAVSADPKEYDAWLARSSVYASLAGVHIDGALARAHESLSRVRQLSPSRPEYYFLSAILAALEGKPADAEDFARQALILKPDYSDAQKLLANLQGQ